MESEKGGTEGASLSDEGWTTAPSQVLEEGGQADSWKMSRVPCRDF
jgi:hypothetical protein